MLTSLYIENLAVIERATINFSAGFHVFTGETGAGKSIVLDAINAVIGQRVSKDIVRNGTEKAVIIAVFEDVPPRVIDSLETYGYGLEDSQLVIQRQIFAQGKTTATICGRPVSVNVLREIGAWLVNIHGQHDNQILLSPARHIDVLDSYAAAGNVLAMYQEKYHVYKQLQANINAISVDETLKAQRMDLLAYQIKEIEEAKLQPGEDVLLEKRKQTAKNAKSILASLQQFSHAVLGSSDDVGAVTNIKSSIDTMERMEGFLEEKQAFSARAKSALFELEEVALEVDRVLEDYDFDPNTLEQLQERIDEIYRLKRKYGESIEQILAHLEKCKQELNEIERSDTILQQLVKERESVKAQIRAIGAKLTTLRQKAGEVFADAVAGELCYLDMPNVKLVTNITQEKFGPKGQDKVEFLISTNPGEPPKSIAKIASGGELSRIMLAIKSTIADKDEIQTLVFDEIDTGVSGRAAQKIGTKIRALSRSKQILCVTHLAQIAALCETHFLIEKSSVNGKTFTEVKALDLEGRVAEVARIMGTDTVTDLMLENAREMIAYGSTL